jgi:hypothetical protein
MSSEENVQPRENHVFTTKVAQKAFEYLEAQADKALEASLGAVIETTQLEPQLALQAKCELQQAHFNQVQNAIVTASQIDAREKQMAQQAQGQGQEQAGKGSRRKGKGAN